MMGALLALVGVVMIVAGFSGRWRALLHALVPSFAHSSG
jgi:hypothetical protein